MIPTKYKDIFIEEENIYSAAKGRLVKLHKWIDNVGYYMVAFRRNGKKHYVRVHRIIAETLVPNPNNLPQVNHKDGDKLNNRLDNLEWVSNADNTQHGYNNGLYHSRHRCNAIRATSKNTGESFEFKSIRSCADALSLNRKTITSILKGAKKSNNYPYNFEYIERVSTIPDECKGVDLEISTKSKRKAA